MTTGRLRTVLYAAVAAVLLGAGSVGMRAQVVKTPSRITAKVDDGQRVLLTGTVHPLARAANDRGVLAASTPLRRMHLVLKHSEAQEASLKELIGDLHDPGSTNFHKWLTPDEFGRRFGPSDEDVAAVERWLSSQGLTVGKVNPGRQTLEVSGNAGAFRQAFGTEIHAYQVHGETHFANASDPQIPAALAPVLGGFASLNNFRLKSYAKPLGAAGYDPATRKVSPSWTLGTSGVYFALAPADFAVQYDLPAASTGMTGTGQTIAVINESNINVYLVNQYRSLFGLPANPPQIIVDGEDPGVDGINNVDGPNYASVEAYLDVELAGAVAPNATIDLVIGADTELESGLILAAEHAVYANLAPVISMSFGQCELNQGFQNSFLSSLWQQAAAQGITVLVSSGDSGSAGCDNDNTQQYAVFGQAVNGLASTPYNVAVGGTDFFYTAYNQGSGALNAQIATYWNTTASSTSPTVSIKGIIPEQPWNDSQYGLNAVNTYTSTGETSIAGGSGGASTCGIYSLSGNGTANCAPYPKPSWQTGTGVPADSARDLPDVSLFAANGNNYSFYPICATDGDCQLGGNIQISGVGGTSASTPAFAGMMALVNQKFGRQGQANYTLYPMAKQFPAAFHDVTVGSISVPCGLATSSRAAKDCITATNPTPPSVTDSTYGTATLGQIGKNGVPAYKAAAGYDLATGLGTIDASVMLANWNKITFAASTTTLTPSSTSFAHGAAVTVSGAVTGSGTPSGSVAVVTDSSLLSQQAQGLSMLSGGAYSGSLSTLPGGTYNLYGIYSGDGVNAASTSAKTAITVTPESSAMSLAALSTTYTAQGSTTGNILSSGATTSYGQDITFTALIAPTAKLSAYQSCVLSNGTCPVFGSPTGSVVYTDSGTTINTTQLNFNGLASYTYPGAVGSHSVTGAYSGDASYSASSSTAFSYTVAKNTPNLGASVTNLNSSGTVVGSQPTVITLSVGNSIGTNPFSATPTGTVTVSGGPAGTPTSATLIPLVDPGTNAPAGLATVTIPAGVTPGTYTLTFTYSGDGNYNTATGTYRLPFVSGSGLTSTTAGTVTASASTPSTPVRLTATVTGKSGSAVPTGTVYAVADGYLVGSITLAGSTSTTATGSVLLTSQSLLQGTNPVVLQYVGDTNYLPSATTITITNPLSDFSINPVATNVVIPASGTVTDTINVTSGQGFAGAVGLTCSAGGGITCSLSPMSVTLASGSTVGSTLTLTNPGVTVAGTYSVYITGTDSTGKYIHTAALQVTAPKAAAAPDFTMSAASSTATTTVGGTTTDRITLGTVNGFSNAVGLSCAVAAGVTCSLAPASVTPASGGTATSVLTLNGVNAGTYSVVVTGTSGALVHTVSVTVTVSAGPDFVLGATATTVSVANGASTTDTILVYSLSGFAGSVNMSCSSTTGLACSLSPSSVTLSNNQSSSTLTLTGSAVGTYTVTITGTSGILSHSITLNVTVYATDFTISALAPSVSVVVGGTATDTIGVVSSNGFNSAVALTCSSSAPGVTCSLGTTLVTPPASGATASSLLTLTGVTAGSYTVTVTGTSGALVHSVSVAVTVTSALVPSFTLSAASPSLSVVAGSSVTDAISVTAVNGFSGSVGLTCNAPTGITCSLAPTSVLPGASSTLTMNASSTSAKLVRTPAEMFYKAMGGTALAALVCWLVPGRRRKWPALLGVALCAAWLGLATGCGSGSSGGGGGAPPIQSASYTVTVTGTSGALFATNSVTLTVTSR